MAQSPDEVWERCYRTARLAASPPELVAGELAQYGAGLESTPFDGDTELEAVLLSRGHPLIALALARYATGAEVVAGLYRSATSPDRDRAREPYWRGMRIACLANRVCGGSLNWAFGTAHWMTEEERNALWKEADLSECAALLANPRIGSHNLAALYKGERYFAGLDSDRWSTLVGLSRDNARLGEVRDSADAPDLDLMQVHEALFHLVETFPPTVQWLAAIWDLVIRLDPDVIGTPNKSVVSTFQRLREPVQANETPGLFLGLDHFRDEVRCIVGAQYGRRLDLDNKKFVIDGTPDDEDIAVRCAYYANAAYSVDEAKKYLERDRSAFAYAALLHKSALLNLDFRRFVERQCVTDENRWLYTRRCQQVHKRWHWRGFDPRPLSEWSKESEGEDPSKAPATRADIEQLGRRLERQSAISDDALKALRQLSVFVMLGLVILLAVIVWRT